MRRRKTAGGGRGWGCQLMWVVVVFFVFASWTPAAPPPDHNPEWTTTSLTWFFSEPADVVLEFLLSGVTSRTRTVYRRELDRFHRATSDVWHALSSPQ